MRGRGAGAGAAGGGTAKPAGESDWRPARPLLALRPGDQVRAQSRARAVVLFHGGGTKVVAPGDPPLTIAAPAAGGGGAQLRALSEGVGRFLLGRQEPPTYRRLATRSVTLPPAILAPRNTRLLEGNPAVEGG